MHVPCTISDTAADNEPLSAGDKNEASLMLVTIMGASVGDNSVICFSWAVNDTMIELACFARIALSRCLQPWKNESQVRSWSANPCAEHIAAATTRDRIRLAIILVLGRVANMSLKHNFRKANIITCTLYNHIFVNTNDALIQHCLHVSSCPLQGAFCYVFRLIALPQVISSVASFIFNIRLQNLFC